MINNVEIDAAVSKCKAAAYTTFFIATCTLSVITYFFFFPTGKDDVVTIFKMASDPLELIGVVFVFILGIGILKKSRMSAILITIYWISAKYYMAMEMDKSIPSIGTIIPLILFLRGIIGSFAYHRIKKAEDSTYNPVKKWMYFLWIPIIIIVSATIFGWLMIIQVFPPSQVISGDKLAHKYKEELVDVGILSPDERVELFYSENIFSAIDDGSVMTDTRVISYQTIDNIRKIYQVNYEDIYRVAMEIKGDFITDSSIIVYPFEEDGFRLFLSVEDDGDEEFFTLLTKKANLQEIMPEPD